MPPPFQTLLPTVMAETPAPMPGAIAPPELMVTSPKTPVPCRTPPERAVGPVTVPTIVATPPFTDNAPPMLPVLESVPLVVASPVMFPLLVKVPAFTRQAAVPLFVAIASARLLTLPALPPCWMVKVALLVTPATVPLTSKMPAFTVVVPETWPPNPTVADPLSTPNVPPIRPVLESVPLVVTLPVMFPLLVKVPAFANEAAVPLFVAIAPARLFTLPALPPCWMVKVALLVTPATVPLTFSMPAFTVVPPV